MSLGLVLTAAAVAWLGTTTGVAALFASAVPLTRRDPSGPSATAPRPSPEVRAAPSRPAPALRVAAGRTPVDDPPMSAETP